MVKRARHLPQPATIHLVIYVVSLLALLFVSFHNLGANAIADFDEARHAVNAYEMMRNGDYLVNTYMGETDLWNLKPPLGYWTVMVGYALFGYTSFGLRFASTVCWIATAFVLARWLRKHAGLPSSICLILLMIASTRLYEAHLVRAGDADAIFTLLCVLELLFLIQARESKWMVLPAGLCVGLAFLAKSWHAFWMFPSTLLFLIVSGMLPCFSVRHVAGYFLASFAPIAVWAAARYAVDGFVFFKTMVEYDLLARSGTTLKEHYGDRVLHKGSTAHTLGRRLRPHSPRRLRRCPGDGKSSLSSDLLRSEDSCFCAVLALHDALGSLLVSTKLVWYVFPARPSWCFIAAYAAPNAGTTMRLINNKKSLANLAPAALPRRRGRLHRLWHIRVPPKHPDCPRQHRTRPPGSRIRRRRPAPGCGVLLLGRLGRIRTAGRCRPSRASGDAYPPRRRHGRVRGHGIACRAPGPRGRSG